MDQETEEQRVLLHKCRLCSKSFSCGRSLGGHMRCHLSSSSMEERPDGGADHKTPTTTNGYGLRENPKKTWRLSSSSFSHPHDTDTADDEQRQCHDCGKNFQSWQALFGHMRCHSHPKRSPPLSREEAADDDSWSVPRKKRMPRQRCATAAAMASEYEQEQVDVAISLMMLSRDVGYWSSTASAEDSADKNSSVLVAFDEFKKPRDYASADDVELYSDGESGKGSRAAAARDKKRASYGGGGKLGKSLYECTTCNKSFHSYQALGGHRAGHKRGRGCLGATSSFETDASVDDRVVEDGAGEVKGSHQCGICGKVFGSGQALGGHKRSHLAMSSVTVANEEEEEEALVAMPDLLDLNLPVVAGEDSSNRRGASAAVADAEFESWWAGSNLRSEAMVGMIA